MAISASSLRVIVSFSRCLAHAEARDFFRASERNHAREIVPGESRCYVPRLAAFPRDGSINGIRPQRADPRSVSGSKSRLRSGPGRFQRQRDKCPASSEIGRDCGDTRTHGDRHTRRRKERKKREILAKTRLSFALSLSSRERAFSRAENAKPRALQQHPRSGSDGREIRRDKSAK